jgi:hypothetical protein
MIQRDRRAPPPRRRGFFCAHEPTPSKKRKKTFGFVVCGTIAKGSLARKVKHRRRRRRGGFPGLPRHRRIFMTRSVPGACRRARRAPAAHWQGCRVIAEGGIFLMNWQSAGSLDGRLFGALRQPQSSGGRSLSELMRKTDHVTRFARLISFFCSVRIRTIPSSRSRFSPLSRVAAVKSPPSDSDPRDSRRAGASALPPWQLQARWKRCDLSRECCASWRSSHHQCC